MAEPARKTEHALTILDACKDPALFAPWFKRGDWSAWYAFLAAVFGLPMTKDQRAIYQRCTGRTDSPLVPFSEGWLVVGRRGGKSFITALVAVWLACFQDYREYLQPGERGTVLILAADRKQARVIMGYIKGLLSNIPMLTGMVNRETTEEIELQTGVSIEIGTASFRSTRGYTVVAALLDEVAFWRNDESANPDDEIINAIQPGMATIPNSIILGLSSPYAKRGALYQAHKEHHGKNSEVLVWQADTRTMNPSVPKALVERAYAKDEAKARAEYGAQFRGDIEQFLAREIVEAATRVEPLELPFDRSNRYFAFVDPSGGGADEFCLAIGHKEDEQTIVDVLRAARGVPAQITADFAELLREYCLSEVVGDKYAGSWPADEFAKHGIRYTPSDKPKSDLYRDSLAAFNSGRVELPPDTKLINQLSNLERRTARGGRDSIDHAPGGHDDRANVVAGLIASNRAKRKRAGAW